MIIIECMKHILICFKIDIFDDKYEHNYEHNYEYYYKYKYEHKHKYEHINTQLVNTQPVKTIWGQFVDLD